VEGSDTHLPIRPKNRADFPWALSRPTSSILLGQDQFPQQAAMWVWVSKPFQAGHAAENGTVAADLAALGWTAASDILEAKPGFFQAAGGGFDANAILGPSPPNAGRYTVASRFRCRSCERGYIFPRAPEQFVASPLCLVGYVRWDARSDRVPPLQTIIFSSFTGRTPGGRRSGRNP
jgi:hypothetical protein